VIDLRAVRAKIDLPASLKAKGEIEVLYLASTTASDPITESSSRLSPSSVKS